MTTVQILATALMGTGLLLAVTVMRLQIRVLVKRIEALEARP
jgi:hypothetical protein